MRLAAVALGLAGLALAVLGWSLDARGFYFAWLSAVVVLAAWPLGSIALLMIHALTGGRWGEAITPALRIGVCALPLLLLATLPLIPGLAALYPWARPGAPPANAFYLNIPFLAVRAVLYAVIWSGLGLLSLRPRTAASAAPAGLFALAVTVSFAAIDSTMALDPHFVSSIYGMLTGAGMVLMALSVAVLASAATAPADWRADLGKLLLALVILWIYLDFMQLLIVWQSDLASDAPWYLPRSRGAWGAVRIVVALGHFVLPFALLLSPRLQKSARAVSGVAALLIAMEVLRAWWTVLPASGRFIGWVDVACMTGVLGTALGTVPWAARRMLRHA